MCATLKWYLWHRHDCQLKANTNRDKNTNTYTNRNTNLWHRYDCQLITRAGIRRLRNHLPNIKVSIDNKDINNTFQKKKKTIKEIILNFNFSGSCIFCASDPPSLRWRRQTALLSLLCNPLVNVDHRLNDRWTLIKYLKKQELDKSPTAFLLNCQCCARGNANPPDVSLVLSTYTNWPL